MGVGEVQGSNQTIHRVAFPPRDADWRWDLSKPVHVVGYSGNQGRCEGIDMNNPNEHGVVIVIRVDRIGRSLKYPNGAPGRATCGARGTVYRTIDETAQAPEQKGHLTWTSDVSITLEPGTQNFQLRVRRFDGQEQIFDGSGSNDFYEVIRTANGVTLRPRIPHSVMQ